MAKKKNRSTNSVKRQCNLCKVIAVAPDGSQHRRCPGSPGNVREKGAKLPSNRRGKWGMVTTDA